MSVNSVVITGNLTKDPELRSTNGGMDVLRFSIAVNERRKNNQTGEWDDYPNYIDCAMFGKRAASVERYISKGSKVSVQGKLRQDRWQKDGKTNSRVYVICDELEFMSQGQKQKQQQQEDGGDFYYSDIPF